MFCLKTIFEITKQTPEKNNDFVFNVVLILTETVDMAPQ